MQLVVDTLEECGIVSARRHRVQLVCRNCHDASPNSPACTVSASLRPFHWGRWQFHGATTFQPRNRKSSRAAALPRRASSRDGIEPRRENRIADAVFVEGTAESILWSTD